MLGLGVNLLAALLLILGAPGLAMGQSVGDGAPPPFRVTADSIESREGGRIIVGRGNVRVRREDWTFYADEVEIDQQEEIFVARGAVLLFDRGNQVQGESLRFHYGTGQGIIHDARGFLMPTMTFSAEELYREDERTYRLVGARYTSCAVCEVPPYSWEIRAKELTIHPDEFAWGTHGSFWLKGVPVMYLPVYYHPLADRKTGFLFPTFGANSKEGFIFGEEFFWAISDSQDATLGLLYRSKRGLSPTVEYRYVLEDGRGSLNSEYLHDRELDEDRYFLQFRHQQRFTSALSGHADVTLRSDNDFPQEFTVDFRDRTDLVNRSTGFLTYALPLHTVTLSGSLQETRNPIAPQADDSLLRIPELSVASVAQPLWEASPLLFDQRSQFVYFDQKNEIALARLDLFPGFSLPTPLTSYITFTPRAGVRGTFYSRGAKDIETDTVTRGLVEMGGDLSTRLFRTFQVQGERLQAIRHTVEPAVGYLYIPEVKQDDIPQIDATDFISTQNRLFLSLTNRFSASVLEPDGARRRFDFFTLTLGSSINLDPRPRTFSDLFLDSLQPEDITQAVEDERTAIPNRPGFSKATERNFANIVYRMSMTPPWPVSLDMSGSFNPKAGTFETTNAGLNGSYKDVASFGLGYTFSRGALQEAIIGTLDLRLFEGAGLTYLGRYDAERGVFSEHQAGVIYQTCCWALNIIYTNRNTENVADADHDIRINLELLTAPTHRVR